MEPWAEARALVALSWPVWMSGLAEAVNGAIAALFLGRNPDAALLGGAYVAMSVFSVLAMYPLMGLSSAVSTLAATAVGAHQEAKIGAYVQLGVGVNLAYAAAWMVPLVVRPAPLLRLVLGDGQPAVATVATAYLRVYALRLFPYALLRPLHRALMAQSVTWPMPIGAAFIVASNAALHAVLVPRWGAVGSAIASTVAPSLQTAAIVALVAHLGLAPTVWGRWDPAAVADAAGPYVRLALPGAAVLCAEWWAMEALTLLMARQPPPVLAAHVVAVNVAVILYMTPASLGLGVMTRVGNALGASAPTAARRACWVATALGGAVGAAQAVALICLRRPWPAVYTANGVVRALLTKVTPVMAAAAVADGLMAVLGRMLRGSGRQRLGATISLLGYWGGILPLCWVLMSASEGGGSAAAAAVAAVGGGGALGGLWVGLAAGKVGLAGVLVAVAVVTDWEDQSRRALQRLGRPAAAPLVGDAERGSAGYGSRQETCG